MAVLPSTRFTSTKFTSTTGTADTLIEVGRFLLEARAASRRAAMTMRNPSPALRADAPPRPDAVR
jgi:hypothetical protein